MVSFNPVGAWYSGLKISALNEANHPRTKTTKTEVMTHGGIPPMVFF